MSWQQRIEQALAERRLNAAYRRRQTTEGGNGRQIRLGDRLYLNFSGNDYLGLSQDARVIAAWQQGARYGVGNGGSGHVTGFSAAHQALEEQLAAWLGYPRALLFISYAANQAVLAALMQKGDRILADRLSHASLLEAAGAVAGRRAPVPAQSTAGLARICLAKPCDGQRLAVTEGLFSMDGDGAPLAELHRLTRAAGAWLMVDDAHGIGVRGEQGRGSCWQQGVRPELLVATFGKAFGVSGAAVLCDEATAEYLLQFARHLIYSTAMPPAQACALQAALARIREGDDLRARLQDNIRRFRQGAAPLALTLTDSDTAIQPLLVGDNQRALDLATRLRECGLWVSAIRPPTVPPGGARLRLLLTAAHQSQDIDRLLEVLNDVSQ
uniref:8-amino-7-oxononanoate synthase n=1 Tax=Serratia marcescens TaxID=615 RepID=BIOF_SERMA|nr:RecName: Full=8-amino-7-oxononanoate synthase; Short=AONS; AltName: Full=7-keto-8-amino-pelargonic acid synthase; Short=7-KAP synthase; Short=KAPA synthase; AltName: Full=8-amino-7-ketopelargonate synthase [Serratia marcescens]BAA04286.1 7-keto-8-aminopelargonic acid synthetase (KAPA synthetase) [Serratia marcescens]